MRRGIKNSLPLAAALCLAAVATYLADEPWSWLTIGVAFAAAALLAQRLPRPALPTWLSRALPPVAICAAVTWTMRDLLTGEIPLSRDHPIHFYKTWAFINDLLPSWQLTGWSERWYGGLPLNEGYPLLPYLWSAALHLVSGGLVGLETSYALGQLALWIVLCLGAYRWGRLLGGPIAGIAAALFLLLDAGAHQGGGREGGWTYLFQFGVWPQALGVALALHGTLSARAALLGRGPRACALTALLIGAALLAHPLSAVPIATISGALWLGHSLDHDAQPLHHRDLAVALVLAALIALFWYGHFISSAAQGLFASAGSTWRDLDDLTESALRGRLFLDGWAIPMVLGLFGALGVARRRSPDDLAVLFVVLGGLLIASPHFWGAAYGAHQLGLLASVQLDRLVIHVKPLFFVLAGVGLEGALRGWRRRTVATPKDEETPSMRKTRRARATLVLLCLITGPLLLWTLRQTSPLLFAEVGQIPTLRSLEHADDVAALSSWLREQRRRAGDEPFRVAIQHDRGRPRVLEELFLIAARAEVSIHHLSSTPADTFRWRSFSDDPADLRALNVRWVVSRRALDQEPLDVRRRFGPWYVYELREPSAARATGRAIGEVRPVVDERERVVFELDGVTPASSLVIHRSPHPRWTARQAGRVVPIELERRPGRATFMRIDELREGTLELSYERHWAHTLLAALSTIAALIALALLTPRRCWPPALHRRLAPLGRSPARPRRSAAPLVVALLIALTALATPLLIPRAPRARDLVELLDHARFESSPSPPCRTHGICRVITRDPIAVLRPRAGVVRPAIRVSAPTAGTYSLRFDDVELGGELRGAWYWSSGPRDGWDLRPAALPRPAPDASVRFGSEMRPLPPAREGQWRDFDFSGAPSEGELELRLESRAPWRLDAFFRIQLEGSSSP